MAGISADHLGLIFWGLISGSVCLTMLALLRRSWKLMAIAAVLSLPFALVANLAYLVAWLIPSLQLAAAIALRWRGGFADWSILLLLAVLVWLVGGAGTIIIDGRLAWVQITGLLIGCVVLLVGHRLWAALAHREIVSRR
jgi:hypothetical protein